MKFSHIGQASQKGRRQLGDKTDVGGLRQIRGDPFRTFMHDFIEIGQVDHTHSTHNAVNCGRYLGHRWGEKDFSVATSQIKGFIPATVVRKTWGVCLLFVWVLQHVPYLWAAAAVAAAPIQCVKITFVRKFSQFLMSKNKNYCTKRCPYNAP